MATESGSPVVIGYDGSAGAREAVLRAAEVVVPRHALIVCVYRHAAELLAPVVGGAAVGRATPEDVAAIRDRAEQLAREGADLADGHGFRTEAVAVEAEGRVADTVLRVARERGAAAIVVGSHGHGGLGSALLGSVSRRLVHESDRPVVVVPPPRSA